MSTWQPPRESEYTPPTEICPHPVWWSAENIMATEVEISMLVAALVRATQPDFIVEVGTHYGQTAERIAEAVKLNGHGKAVSLEIDLGMYQSAMNRCLQSDIELKLVDSLQYIPPVPIDFLFVDGALDRCADVRHFLPYMAPRGMICVHDTAHPPYSDQVPEILDLCGGSHIQIDCPRGFLIIKLP